MSERRSSRKGKKLVPYNAYQYSFRLTDREDEMPYKLQLDEWITHRDEDVSQSARLAEIVKWLMDHASGQEIPSGDESGIARLINRRFDRVEKQIQDRVEEILKRIIENPRAMQRMNTFSERRAQGEAIDDDFIDNILEDFGRE